MPPFPRGRRDLGFFLGSALSDFFLRSAPTYPRRVNYGQFYFCGTFCARILDWIPGGLAALKTGSCVTIDDFRFKHVLPAYGLIIEIVVVKLSDVLAHFFLLFSRGIRLARQRGARKF